MKTLPRERALLIYDGDCNFCKGWVKRWEHSIGDRIDYAQSQKVAHEFPISPQVFKSSVVLIDKDGAVYKGAKAVFKALSNKPGKAAGVYYYLYERIGFFALICEKFYSLVAKNRGFFSSASRFFWGKNLNPSTYHYSSWLFVRLLGVVGLIAILSLWTQATGLFSSDGIAPIANFMSALENQNANDATPDYNFFDVPTLFWLADSNFFIHLVFAGGALTSVLLIFGLTPAFSVFLLWLFYLSITVAGQRFMNFQWDTLLLETLFLTLFFAAWKKRDKLASHMAPSALSRCLLWLLLFKLMFESGVSKFTYFDATGGNAWRDWTALNYHYFTQPLPNPLSAFFHRLPQGMQNFSLLMTYAIELVLPFFIFFPRRLRNIAFMGFVALQVGIIFTGNYGYFNLLTLLLCIPLIDDQSFPKGLAGNLSSWLQKGPFNRLEKKWGAITPFKRLPQSPKSFKIFSQYLPNVRSSLLVIVAVFSIGMLLFFVGRDFRGNRVPADTSTSLVKKVYNNTRNFHFANSYGLFRVVTMRRPEIIISGSNDGQNWEEYSFRYKPGNPEKGPWQVAPHMPRLDWQMWFVALENERLGRGRFRNESWFVRFLGQVLQNDSKVLSLMKESPFPEKSPLFYQIQLYHYTFADSEQRKEKDIFWERKLLPNYTVQGRVDQLLAQLEANGIIQAKQ